VAEFFAELPRGSRILDFGCGNGALLSSWADSGFELHGVDASSSGIRQAKDQNTPITFHLADITATLPAGLAAERFDAIICTEVIEHVFAPRNLVRNAFDLLKPGGEMLITTPYHGYLKNLSMAITGRMDKHFTVLWDCGHIKFWSQKTLSLTLREAGFHQLRFSGVGRVPGLWKSMVFRCRRPQ
jgi:2-polyprenyl-6-hydroxyphenyl methylase/3-demethylubiquinone-9 3-methyltransferase